MNKLVGFFFISTGVSLMFMIMDPFFALGMTLLIAGLFLK